MSIADKLTQIAQGVQKVYEAGKAAGGYTDGYDAGRKFEHDKFWGDIQGNGARTFYERAFQHWNMEYIRPTHKVVPSGSRSMNMFSNNNSLKMVEKKYFDLSQVTVSQGGESSSNLYGVFYSCPNLEVVEDIGMPAGGYYMTFNRCPKLHTIEVMRVVEQSEFMSVFTNCYELVNLTIDGTIGKNGFDVSYCTKLSHDSLMSIINALKSGASNTITLGTANLAKLTNAEKAIATQKGWTLA
jgi:hypothetical protein